jgi:Tfp pilus assembly protein FimT
MALKAAKSLMLTSTPKTSNPESGFSILEIMVAIVVVALVFLAIPTGDTTYLHRKLTEAVDDIDRAVRFAANESTLRNSIVRLKFDLEKSPITYTVEYGPRGNLTIPEAKEEKDLSLDELKKEQKEKETFDAQFSAIEEFKDLSRPLSLEVNFIGLGTTQAKNIQTDGMASVYFYPTGEKDEAIIFLAAGKEIGIVEIQAFQEETIPRYHTFTLDEADIDKLDNLRENKVEEEYRAWLKP